VAPDDPIATGRVEGAGQGAAHLRREDRIFHRPLEHTPTYPSHIDRRPGIAERDGLAEIFSCAPERLGREAERFLARARLGARALGPAVAEERHAELDAAGCGPIQHRDRGAVFEQIEGGCAAGGPRREEGLGVGLDPSVGVALGAAGAGPATSGREATASRSRQTRTPLASTKIPRPSGALQRLMRSAPTMSWPLAERGAELGALVIADRAPGGHNGQRFLVHSENKAHVRSRVPELPGWL
jgi:hypothetical protein